MHLRKLVWLAVVSATLFTCNEKEPEDAKVEDLAIVEEIEENIEFGFNLDNFIVKRDTIKSGDSFGEILERNNIGYPKIFQIAEKAKDTF
ncbi:MAG: M23 family peptidase, partial [Winogradskyella sp.]|nr:M23 family peptidase [Winogradskyella sp.]